MLNDFLSMLFGELDQDVHAKDDVHFSDVNAVAQVHLNEINHLAKTGTNLLTSFRGLKMTGELLFADACDAATGVDASFGNGKRLAADVGSENFDIPSLREGNSVGDGNCDGVGFFPSGTTGTPNAKRPRILQEHSMVDFGQNALFERLENTWIAEERGFLRE